MTCSIRGHLSNPNSPHHKWRFVDSRDLGHWTALIMLLMTGGKPHGHGALDLEGVDRLEV